MKARILLISWAWTVFFLHGAFGQTQPIELQIPLQRSFRFVAYGDTRFTDPKDTEASNPEARRTLGSFCIIRLTPVHPITKWSEAAIPRGAGTTASEMLEARQGQLRARLIVFSAHIHNYERHEHGGIPFFVTGGGGAHAYPIERDPKDVFQSKDAESC